MFFKDIIGQESVKQHLIETAKGGKIPHAQLFCGEAGYGTFPLALSFARYLNCLNRSETDACGTCSSCLKYNELVHPDLYFIFPMITNKERKKQICDDYMPEWRQFLKSYTYFDLNMWLNEIDAMSKQAIIYAKESEDLLHKVSLRIYEAAYRIFMIWVPERMHITCANKLLKVIEEPPQNTLVFLISENPDQVLGTIQSRSQRIHIHPIHMGALATVAEKEFELPADQAQAIAHMSHGNYLQMVENIQTSEEKEYFLQQFIRIMRNSWSKNVKEMKLFAEEMAGIGRERQKNFLTYCQHLIRENFIARFGSEELNFMNPEEISFSTRFAPYINERNVFDFMDELAVSERHIAQNGNAKMIFFDLALQITVLLKK